MKFTLEEDFATKLDKKNKLNQYRDRFFNIDNTIYLNGNSLGLYSKNAKQAVEKALRQWKELGVGGWWADEQPWFYYGERIGAKASPLVGAKPEEVVCTGTTTVNIHSLISTFYKPKGKKMKILADELNFPTDIYALESQIRLKELDPSNLVLIRSKDGFTLDEEEIVKQMNDEVALIFLPSVLFKSGQLLDMEYLTKEAHKKNIPIGFDCSHSVGVVPHDFNKWQVDFAVWCSYKYLNGGPGGPAFIYINEQHFSKEPGLPGWFGYVKEKQFDMVLDFNHAKSAGGWQISSTSIVSSALVDGAIDIHLDAGIEEIRKQSLQMTAYFRFLLEKLIEEEKITIITPKQEERRGGHIAFTFSQAEKLNKELLKLGIIHDFRPPNILRFTPNPLYNTYEEIRTVVTKMQQRT